MQADRHSRNTNSDVVRTAIASVVVLCYLRPGIKDFHPGTRVEDYLQRIGEGPRTYSSRADGKDLVWSYRIVYSYQETEISETEKSDRVKWSISESAGSENGPQAMRVRISCRDFVVFFGAGRTYNRREIFSMMGHCVRARRVVHNLRSGTGRMDSQLCRLLCSSTGD